MPGFRELMYEKLAEVMRGSLPKDEYLRSLVGVTMDVFTTPERSVTDVLQCVDESTFQVGDVIFKPEQVETFIYSHSTIGAPTALVLKNIK